MDSNLLEILEDEWCLVRYSGETPEIALHSAIYFLTRAKGGPRVNLSKEYLDRLRDAAVERFSEIILRDLRHGNVGTPTYRGLERSIINYRRFCTFCQRQKIDPAEVRRQAAESLLNFLVAELAEISKGGDSAMISCSYLELKVYAAELDVDLGERFAAIASCCLPEK